MSLPTIFECEHCGKTVCNVCYCTWTPGSPMPQLPVRVDVHTAIFHALWQELHTEVRTAEQFEAWVKRVPSFGCSCASWLKDYLAKNPLLDGDLAEYGFHLHNAVNQKLNKTEFSWAEFETKYGSHTDGNQDSG